jgi:hypothetical protein
MRKEVREAFRVHYKWTVIEYAKICRTVAKACREFEVPRSIVNDLKLGKYEGGIALWLHSSTLAHFRNLVFTNKD